MDEHQLAAFLAGTLPPKERQRVIRHLVKHTESRKLLHMALQAERVVDNLRLVPLSPPSLLFPDVA